MAAAATEAVAVSNDDWFRVPCLTEEARAQFEQRLTRSRSARPEYMRIQAHALLQAGAHHQAITLLDRVLTDFPHHLDAWLFQDRAECYRALGRPTEAIQDYRNSVRSMRSRRGAVSDAPARLAQLAWEEKRSDLYDEALGYLTEFWNADPIFPQAELHQFGLAAVLLHALGKSDEATPLASRALEAAAKTRSGAAKHPSLGLVRDRDIPLVRTLEQLALPGDL